MGRNVSELERHVDVIVALQDVNRTTTELVAQLRGLTINNVLFSGTVQLDSAGTWTRDWSVPFASVAVGNFGDSLITVTSDSLQSSAPFSGEGTRLLGPGDAAVFNLAGRVLTLYGDPGDRVSLEVLDKPQGSAPSSGAGGPTATNGAPVAVASDTNAKVLMAANRDRAGGLIFNNSTATLFVSLGGTPTLALFSFKIGPGLLAELTNPIWTGSVSGIWDAIDGNAMVTEFT